MTAPLTLDPVPGPPGAPPHGLRALGRVRAMVGYAVLLALWTWFAGMPNDTIQVFLWLWLGTIAWNIEAEPREHLRFLRDWAPFLAALVVYFYSRALADNLDRGVSVLMPVEVDRWLFGGHLPTEVLQAHLCGTPCLETSDPRWYDAVLTTVYASHFVVGLTLAAVLWVRDRPAWARWMRRLLAISFGALVVYVLYPMAPPWWASEHGHLAVDLPRLTGRGWEDLGIHRLNLLLGGASNKVAAMPSLHAGLALLATLWWLARGRSPWRWLLLVYPPAMGLALVYLSEHYVIDVLAGWALAGAVAIGCSAWERARGTVSPRSASPRG